ncbi:MAG: long-chain-fatty-acid--CoA ligase [Steroidobacteraceae bacterium]
MAITQGIKRALQQYPGGRASVCGSRSLSWQQLARRAAQLAGGLQSLGIEAGDRVAVLALNSDRYLEAYAGVAWAGAVIVPLNTRWSPAENIYAINDSGAAVLLVDDTFAAVADSIRTEIGSVRAVVHMGDAPTPAYMSGYERLIDTGAPVADAGRSGEDLAGIFYTGGTTGFPKGVMLSHRSLWSSAAAGISLLPRNGAESIYLHAAPMFHMADFGFTMVAFLAAVQSVIIPSFTAAGVLAAIEEHRVTIMLLVPTMIHMLVTHPMLPKTDLSSLQRVIYGASPMPEELLCQAMRALPHCEFVQAYGQTELSPIATALLPEYHTFGGPKAGKLTSAGRAVACCEIEVVDASGREVQLGTVGEIRVRGYNTMLGYWNKPEETAATLRDGWVYTGDAGRMDEEGFLYVVDRIKDMIISGGENVYTAEVENACVKHPAVAQCAVIGIPDDTWGEAVHAIVIIKDGHRLAAEELIAHCHGLIAGYKCPHSVEIRSQPLPMSGAGKILKRELRAPHWQGRRRQVN